MSNKNLNEVEIFNEVKTIIEELLQTYRTKDLRQKLEIRNETDVFKDLEIDSLEIMDLIGIIENKFKISVKPEDLVTKSKIKDIVEHIIHLNQKK